MLQESSGLDLCATLRRDGNDVPILFLSARGTVGARVEGLEAGGDDYLPKPFAMRELKARVHALGRRGRARRPVSFRSGPCTFDFDRRRAELAGVEVPVTAREWELLEVLIEAGGAVVPYQDLLESLWGEVSDETRASLDVIVSRLRSKLRKGANGESVVRTVRGRGYALRVDQ
jgi:DNA-binding response OmpR family regulator